LTGINLSGAKIQGVNFKCSLLKNANLAFSEAGVDGKNQRVLILLFLILISVLSYSISFSGISIVYLLASQARNFSFYVGMIVVSWLVISVLNSLLGKLTASKKMTLQKFLARSMALLGLGISSSIIVLTTLNFGSLSITLVITGVLSGILCQLLATLVSIVRSAIYVLTRNQWISSSSTLLGLIGAILALANFQDYYEFPSVVFALLMLAAPSAMLGEYAGRGAVSGDPLWSATLRLAIAIISFKSTSFCKSDLSGANFSSATLQGVDFRLSNIHLARWTGVKNLEYARVGDSYLSDRRVQDLARENCGENKVFSDLNLDGINLDGALLKGADFSRSNLNNCSLRDSDLRGSILKQTQLDKSDLSYSDLTGACIEEWGITAETTLNGVRCEYVFMQLADPQKGENPRRKPEDWDKNFAEGEFSDFIEPLVKTLDLYHNQTVDPRILTLAFNNLRENHKESEPEIVSMEKRGTHRDKLLIRVATNQKSDHSVLHKDYFEKYNELSALPPDYLNKLLQEKDGQIQMLKSILDTTLNRATIQAGTYFNKGDTMSEKKGNVNIENLTGKVSGFAVAGENQEIRETVLGELSGDVDIAINSLADLNTPDDISLQRLLEQLKISIQQEDNLSPEDKSDLLEQLKNLVEAKKTSDEVKKRSLVRKAKKIFDATVKTLPDTAKVADACSRLFPLILKCVGVTL
jgi:uncharacterized protein YjbI with pentapeptide repeats